MKICPNCKCQNYDNAQFCFRCGYPFYNTTSYQQPYYPQQNNFYNNVPLQKQNYYMEPTIDEIDDEDDDENKVKSKKLIKTIIILVVLLVPFMILLNSSKKRTMEYSATSTRIAQSTQVQETLKAVVAFIQTNPPTPAPERTEIPKDISLSSTSKSKSYSTSNSDYAEELSVGDPHFIDVWICAQDLVKANLKAPRTAKFPSQYDIMITYLGSNNYRILGYVDSQNSFGAMLRTGFIATLTLTSGGYKNGSVVFY